MDTAANTPPEGELKREQLRKKIETAEARHAERSMGDYAREARGSATGFVREHPFATVGAALAAGVVLAAIIPGPGRRLSQRVGKNVGARASAFAAIASELGLTYGTSLMNSASDAARTGQDKLEDLGDTFGDSARSARREASHRAARAADSATSLKRDVSKKAGRAVRGLRSRIS